MEFLLDTPIKVRDARNRNNREEGKEDPQREKDFGKS